MPHIPSRVIASQYGSKNPAGRRRPQPTPIILQKGSAQGLEQTGDRQTQRLQQAVVQSTQAIRSLPFAGGNLIEGISLASGANTIAHGLPQAWRGALLTTPSVSVTWHVGQTSPANALRNLVLTVSSACTASLWVW